MLTLHLTTPTPPTPYVHVYKASHLGLNKLSRSLSMKKWKDQSIDYLWVVPCRFYPVLIDMLTFRDPV